MISMAELMADSDLGARSIVLKRPTVTYVKGVATTTYAADASLTAIVQPAKPQDAEMLPEGKRLSDVQAIWSATELRAGDGKTIEGDILVFDGKKHRVVAQVPWAEAGFYKVLAEGLAT